jgi:Methyltransferase domain
MQEAAGHWDNAYANRGGENASWYQTTPRMSLKLLDALDVGRDVGVIDVGGGASRLVDELVAKDFTDVSVLDLSGKALAETRRRLGQLASVELLHADVLAWQPQRRYGLWHDRALFHFLVDPGDRNRYLQTLRSAVEDNGAVVLATFAPDGPPSCSGLPVARYTADDLMELLGPGFDRVDAHREEHVTPRGSIQAFTWVAGRMTGASRPT